MSKLLVTGSIVGALVLTLAQIVFSSAFATDGIELNRMQAQLDSLQKENTLLKEQVYAVSSITTIAQKAEDMGYTMNKKSRLVLSSPQPIALNQ